MPKKRKQARSIGDHEAFNKALLFFADVCERANSADHDLWQSAYEAASLALALTIDLYISNLLRKK